MDPNIIIYFLIGIIVVLVIIIFVVLFLFLAEKFKCEPVELLIKLLCEHIPSLYRRFPILKKWWISKGIAKKISKKIAKDIGDKVDIQISFVEGKDVDVTKDGATFIVVYDPSESSTENIVTMSLAVAKEIIPFSEKILDFELRECISLYYAKNILESNDHKEALQFFGSNFLIDGESSNNLTDNKYYAQIEEIGDKNLFLNLLVRGLVLFGSNFDTTKNSKELMKTSMKFFDRVHYLASRLYFSDIASFTESFPPEYPHYRYFFNENGLCLNVMLIRNESYLSENNINAYEDKMLKLIKKGMDVCVLINSPTDIRTTSRKLWDEYYFFTKKVSKRLDKKVKLLKCVKADDFRFDFAKKSYPSFVSIFKKRYKS